MTENDESEQCKDVYAHAGLALYWAQCLEKSLENFFLLHGRLSDECISIEDIERIESEVEAFTLGRLLSEARKHIDFDVKTNETVKHALSKRNYLVHRFFKSHAENFISKPGRDVILKELFDIQECLKSVDSLMSSICHLLQRKIGIPDEHIEQELRKMEAQAAARNENRDG